MSGIFDQIINYSPPLIVSGTVNYKGTWNASTNTPTLIDPPVASTKGDYYVVSTAGTQFSITFGVGDWIISNGTAWEKVDLTDAVSSVFGRTGAVVGDSTDYSAVGITNTAIGASSPSTGAFTSLSSSSTTTLNGTTIPASKTLVVTTDKLSALAATTSAELAGVISDETGSGALVFANSPTLVTPALGTPSSGTVTNLTGTASININGTVGATTPTTGVFTGLTVNDNTTLGSSNSDTVNFNARVASDLNPSTDDTYDLGVTGHEWRNLNIDGTANIDSLVADTADINGGTIDGTAIGATTPSTVAATTITATGSITTSGGTLETNRTGAVDAFVRISADAGRSKNLSLNTAGARRWTVSSNSTAESGSNAGSDFVVTAYSDADASLGSALTITRANRSAVFAGGINSTAIGATTPSTGAFTTLSATGAISGQDLRQANDGFLTYDSGNVGSKSLTVRDGAGNTRAVFSSTGLAVTGALSSTTGANFATSSGFVGFGRTNPICVIDGKVAASASNVLAFQVSNDTNTNLEVLLKNNVTTINAGGTGTLVFATESSVTERARITSAGLAVTGQIGNFFTGANGQYAQSQDNTSGANFHVFYNSASVACGSISRVTTTNAVVFNTTSDGRLKENFRDFTDSGRLIDSLKPRVFDWKNSDENGKNVVGFVAQEQHAADPIFAHIGAVSVGDDDPDTITKQWQRSDSALIPILVAELKSLRARVAALES